MPGPFIAVGKLPAPGRSLLLRPFPLPPSRRRHARPFYSGRQIAAPKASRSVWHGFPPGVFFRIPVCAGPSLHILPLERRSESLQEVPHHAAHSPSLPRRQYVARVLQLL